MGDEPYAALLPWVAFAVVDRVQGDGPVAAAIAGIIAAVTLLLTQTRTPRSHNVIAIGAIVWFGAMTAAALSHDRLAGVIDHDGRAVSALGFVLLAYGSLLFTPVMEHYTRPHVRPARRTEPAFRAVNAAMTRVWGTTFVVIALSHLSAGVFSTHADETLLNWIVPIAVAALAAHRSHDLWDDFLDDDPDPRDPLHDLTLDWEPPAPPD